MIKKVGIPLLTTSLVIGVLTGCGANKKEFAEGIELYNKGNFESLVESKDFFLNYIETNGNDKKAEKWLKNINKELIKQAKTLTDSAYASQDFEAAFEYIKVALSADPSNEDFQKVYSLVETALKEQKLYDEYADFLEEIYVLTKKEFVKWETLLKSVKNNQASIATVNYNYSNTYTEISKIREIINKKTFELTDKDNAHYKEINLALFEYIVDVENELAKLSYQDVSDFFEKVNKMKHFTITAFANQFSDTADAMLSYTTQTNREGEKIRNIVDTLDLAKAYEDSLNESLN